MLKISQLKVENLTKYCITDSIHPRISYSVESDKKNIKISEAVITVDDWQKSTKEQILIPYEGKKLSAFTLYPVNIYVQDSEGETARAEMTFETGRLSTPWIGKWITDKSYHFKTKKNSPLPMIFRKKFTCENKRKIRRARLYSTALGIYELQLNNEKVGNDYFAPGLTSYKHSLQYQTYDITNFLKTENELSVVVGGGWAVGAFSFNRKNRITASRQSFLCEIRITYNDGSVSIIGTDDSWQVSLGGNYKYADFYDGEIYDARVTSDQIQWRQAGVEKLVIQPEILASYGSLVQRHEVMKPIHHFRSKSGVEIYDFGQNFAGVLFATMKGTAGQVITFKHTEILMNDELYPEPLRSAKACVIYTCKEGEQSYSPKLTYMGFRYIGVTGIKPEDLKLSAYVLHSTIEPLGEFSCSNKMINRLQQNICWSTKSNFMDIPTDCPQRDERMGWTGDIALFAPTACYNFDTQRFLEKWLMDVKSEQRKHGGINVVIPEQGFKYPPAVVAYWGDCCILVPWALYEAYGNVDILKNMYPVMKKYLEAVKFWAGIACFGKTNRHTWRWFHQYGDWVAPGVSMFACMNRGLWTATACWSHSCFLMSKIAAILQKTDDSNFYKNLKKKIDDAYTKRFFNDTGRMKRQFHPFSVHALGKEKEFQTGYVLPIAFDMLQENIKSKIIENLVRMVKDSNYHIRTGFPGTPFILFALADNGYKEEAFKMLLQNTCPSWLYEVKTGGTTIWERWDALRENGTCNTGNDDGTGGMTSFNHYASGSVGAFLYRRIAGIEMTAPGYKSFRIKPLIGGDLTFCHGSVISPYGKITSDWKIENGFFSISIDVPVGTSAELTLPDSKKTIMLGSGHYEYKERQ